MHSPTPMHIEDAVKLLVQSIQATSDLELFGSWALTAVIAELELDLDLLTGDELERLGGIVRLTELKVHQSRFG